MRLHILLLIVVAVTFSAGSGAMPRPVKEHKQITSSIESTDKALLHTAVSMDGRKLLRTDPAADNNDIEERGWPFKPLALAPGELREKTKHAYVNNAEIYDDILVDATKQMAAFGAWMSLEYSHKKMSKIMEKLGKKSVVHEAMLNKYKQFLVNEVRTQ